MNRTMARRGFPFTNEAQPEDCSATGVADGVREQTTDSVLSAVDSAAFGKQLNFFHLEV